MKMFVAWIILILTSFLAPIKVTCQRFGPFGPVPIVGAGPGAYAFPSAGYKGGDHSGGVPPIPTGYMGGQGIPGPGTGYMGGQGIPAPSDTGYKGGSYKATPQAGGDTGPALVIIPKQPDDPVAPPVVGGTPQPPDPFPMPHECRPEVRGCVNSHLYEVSRPTFHGRCCMLFKHSKRCVCKFQTSGIFELSKAAYGVVKGCHFISKTDCPRTY